MQRGAGVVTFKRSGCTVCVSSDGEGVEGGERFCGGVVRERGSKKRRISPIYGYPFILRYTRYPSPDTPAYMTMRTVPGPCAVPDKVDIRVKRPSAPIHQVHNIPQSIQSGLYYQKPPDQNALSTLCFGNPHQPPPIAPRHLHPGTRPKREPRTNPTL